MTEESDQGESASSKSIEEFAKSHFQLFSILAFLGTILVYLPNAVHTDVPSELVRLTTLGLLVIFLIVTLALLNPAIQNFGAGIGGESLRVLNPFAYVLFICSLVLLALTVSYSVYLSFPSYQPNLQVLVMPILLGAHLSIYPHNYFDRGEKPWNSVFLGGILVMIYLPVIDWGLRTVDYFGVGSGFPKVGALYVVFFLSHIAFSEIITLYGTVGEHLQSIKSPYRADSERWVEKESLAQFYQSIPYEIVVLFVSVSAFIGLAAAMYWDYNFVVWGIGSSGNRTIMYLFLISVSAVTLCAYSQVKSWMSKSEANVLLRKVAWLLITVLYGIIGIQAGWVYYSL